MMSMSEQCIPIAKAFDIPVAWGTPRRAARKTTISRREPNGVETFTLAWGTLTAKPGEDWVIVQDSGEEYPIKRAILADTYEEVAPGRFRKTARSRLVQVPEGVTAVLATKEGELEVRHPDYVAIGAEGEVYANSAAWVAENLQFVDP
jgi:hypothetical protein